MRHQKVILAILALLIFFFSFGAHYFVYLTKGDSHVPTEYYNLLPARNWAETGELSYENSENVVLSTEMVETDGMPTTLGNKLTLYFYGFLFKYIGFYPSLPLYIAFILYSIAAVFLFLTVLRIFDLKIGLTTAILSVIAPFSLPPANMIGHHELAWLFMILAAFFYFWPKNQKKLIYLVSTGLCLGLAMAAKNSFFIAFLPFFALEFWRNRLVLKTAVLRCAILFVAFLIIATPFTFGGQNSYLGLFFNFDNSVIENEPFSSFGHFFPDPYTYHHDRDAFLENNLAKTENFSFFKNVHFWGEDVFFIQGAGASVNFMQGWVMPMIYSFLIYSKGLFLSLIIFGGMLTWLFVFIGISELKRRKNYLMIFFSVVFFASWFFCLIAFRTSNYAQVLILALPASIVVGVGLCKTAEFISRSSKKILIGTIAMFLILFSQISWWSLHINYATFGQVREVIEFARTEQNKYQFDEKGVTAVGWFQEAPTLLNYYFNRNFVYFAPQTIKKLADKDELSSVFQNYNITGFIGYDEKTTEIINNFLLE